MEVQLQHDVSQPQTYEHLSKNFIPEFGVEPFRFGDLLGNVCSEADLPWPPLATLPCGMCGDLNPSSPCPRPPPPPSAPAPASDPMETIDIDLLCLCPIPPLALGAGSGDTGGLAPAGTLSESAGLCPELDRPIGNLGLIAPDRVPGGSCSGAPLPFTPPNAFPFVWGP